MDNEAKQGPVLAHWKCHVRFLKPNVAAHK